jgi:hypothetical protein
MFPTLQLCSSLSFKLIALILVKTQASCGLHTGMIFRGLSFRWYGCQWTQRRVQSIASRTHDGTLYLYRVSTISFSVQ